MNDMRHMRISFLGLILIFASLLNTSVAYGKNHSPNRKRLLTTLRTCTPNPRGAICENAIEEAIKRFNRGDKALLRPLIALGPNSDAFVAEMLGDFYGNTLWKSPRLFLRAIADYPKKEQKEIAWHAATMDGGGMSDKMVSDIKLSLGKLAGEPRRRVGESAKVCLREIETANKKGSKP